MASNSESKKRRYAPPAATRVTLHEAKEFVADRANWSDQEATDLLESLRRELRQSEK